ncbi:TDIF2 protein, partial [Centropus unirufus]|nr:TDIF2 protein [Centropus unirufus]
EPQAGGDVSETESNCSAVSGLQTPLIVRVTRRRQIVVPYQSGSPSRKKQGKAGFLKKVGRFMDEDDVSEAESCSSAFSDVQMPSITRTTRSRQRKNELQSNTVCEAQSEGISDAELCCLSSRMEPSVTTKRITRSGQMKLQAANNKQKGNRIVSEDENLVEDMVKSEPVIISDSRPAEELLSDTEDVSSVTEDNKEPNSPSKSSNRTPSEDVKERVMNDGTPSSLTKMKQRGPASPEKMPFKNTQSVWVGDSEEACSQTQEEHSKVLVREVHKGTTLALTDCMSPKRLLESQGRITPNESKRISEHKRADAGGDAEEPFALVGKLGTGDQSSAVSSPQKGTAITQGSDSAGGSEVLDVDKGEGQTGEGAESHSSERSSSGNNSIALFFSKDGSDGSESSEAADIDTVEDNLCIEEANERTPSREKSSKNSSLNAEGFFVIDAEPGMSSSKKYYLDQVDQRNDAERKHKVSEKESSDLEEAEEDLIDEDEKDEDDDLLKTKIDVLHLSSSIDPGLNIKKLGGLYISFDAKKQKPTSSVIKQLKDKKKDQLLQNSVITPDFEKKECVPPFRESLHQLKKQRRAEREKTTGDGWFGMKAPEMTSELKNDLKVLKMRASLDPKHFYKKNDRDGLPKYFQVGTVVDSPIDFYHSRIPKKQRKRTIVEELLADSEFRRYNKKKYQEIMSEKAAFAAGKRNRKKKKFRN